MRLLFVEDNLELQHSLLAELESEYAEWELDFAADIDEAWRMFCEGEYDCLILDVMLPTKHAGVHYNGEGICLAKWVWGHKGAEVRAPDCGDVPEWKRHTPVVFHTSRTIQGVRNDIDASDGKFNDPIWLAFQSRLDDVEETVKTIVRFTAAFVQWRTDNG